MSDPISSFHSIPEAANNLTEITALSDIYAYGVEPLPDRGLLMTAERADRPIIVRIDAKGRPEGTAEVCRDYRGISGSSTAKNGVSIFVTYDTEPGAAKSRLETWDVSDAEAMRRVSAEDIPLGATVLRVYDVGVASWKSSEVLSVVALIRDEETGAHKEGVFLLRRGRSGLVAEGRLPRMSALNELRSIRLVTAADGAAVYAVACRRFWLKNEAFLFRILPEEDLLARRSFDCHCGDFQQVGTTVERNGKISLACIHRHRRDVDGIKYNIEEFRSS